MFQQQSILHILNEEYQRHNQLIHKLTKLQKQLPEGHLCSKKGYLYRGVSVNGKREQIPISQGIKNREALIHELQSKRHLSKVLPILVKNQESILKFLNSFQVYDPAAIRSSLPAHYHDFDFTELMLSGDINPDRWVSEEYDKNSAYPENLKYQSEGGLLTRSKAEADIATMLERKKLAFRYEPTLEVGTQIYCPDFCILHPVHRCLIYWEHFGQMDVSEYAYKTMEKLTDYAENGYYLGLNLIMTFETKKSPLHFGQINQCIKKYFS